MQRIMSKMPNELTIAEAARALRARGGFVRGLWGACRAEGIKGHPELEVFSGIFFSFKNGEVSARGRPHV